MQHYIKCSHCKELISVKSEYMMLCPHCQKKLDNSYREWSKKNIGATFEQYLAQECVSQTAISGLDDQRKISRKIGISRNVKRLAAATAIALVVIAAGIWGIIAYKDSQKGASINAILNDTWKIRYYEELGATVKFPFELTEQANVADSSLTLSDSTQTIVGYTSRSWSRVGVTAVVASRVDFAPAFGTNREGATQQILQSIVNNNEMKGFEFVPSDYTMSPGVKARMFSGSYLIKAEAYQFRAVMIVRGDKVWYFMVAYLRSMPEGTLLAEKFFKGILI